MADVLEPLVLSRSAPSEPKASILLVDDNPANLLSLRAILEDLGQNLVETRSGEEALRRVESDEFAVVLLDVLMPGISGFETAKLIRRQDRSRHTPIIFLTASDIDSPQIEEGYALGAVDFLVKPLLPVVLQSKVRGFVELYQDKQRAKHEADQLRLLVEGAKDYAIFRLDQQGYVASWNPGAERIKGYKANEIIGQHFSRFYPQEAINRGWPAHELKVAKAEGRFEDEGWRIRKDGTHFWANVVITALHDGAGSFVGFSKITRDLTERKKSEENARRLAEETAARQVTHQERERLRVTLASIGDAVISTDAEGRVDFLNPVAQEFVGWKTEEAASRTLEDVFRIVNEDTRQPVENPALRALKDGVIVGLANHTVLIARDGKERPIDDSAAPIRDAGGGVVGSVLVFRDISERKRAEAAMNERVRLLTLNTAVGAALVQADQLRPMLQRCAEALVDHLHGAFARIWTVNPQGDVLELQASAGLYTHLDGPHSRVPVGQYKIGLIAQERRSHLTNAVANDPRVSDREWAQREGMVAFAGYPLLVDDRLVGVLAMFARQPLSDATVEAMASVANGIAVGVERKVAEEERRRQQEWLRVTLASIGDGMIATDPHGRVTFLNGVAQELTGWTQVDAEGQPLEAVFTILNEQTRQPVQNPVERVLRDGVIVGLGNHTVLIARDGTEWPIDDSAAPIRDTAGEMIGVVLIFRDVTQQRQAEKEVRQSEARKTAILETALDCIITIDHEGKVVEFNSAAERTFGHGRAQVVGRELADLIIPPPLRERHRRGMAHYLATGEGPVLGKRLELPALRADGTEFPAELAITRISTDGPPLFTAYLRDITEQKRAERHRNVRLALTHALSEAPDVREGTSGVLRAVCENLGWDVGFFWTVNEGGDRLVCRASWHRPGEAVDEFETASCGRTFERGEGLPGRVWASGEPAWVLDVLHDANFPRLAFAAQYGLHSAFACPVVGDQTLGVIEFFTKRIREADADLVETMGTVAGSVGQFIERKAAEDELRRSETELAEFFENATIGLHWVGPDGTILRANRAELEMLGYSREEYVGHPIADFHADKDVIFDILKRLQAGEKLDEYPARLRCKDGSIRDVLIDSSVMWRDGEFVHTRCFTRDVTERKRAEAALRQSQEQLAAELEATTRLHALSTRLLTAVDLHEALDDVLQGALLACRAKFGNVQLFNPESHALEIIAQRGFREDFLEHFRTVRIDEGSACAQAMRNEERIIIEDVELDPPYEPLRHVAAAAGYRAVQSTPLKNREGSVIGMLSTHYSQPHRPSERDLRLLDLHARHAADLIVRHAFEEALRRSEAQFRQLADAMPQIVWTARPDGNIDYLNRRWTEFTGLPDTVGNEGLGQIFHPDDAPPAAERWAVSLRTGAPFEMELRLLDRRQQSYRWYLNRTVAVHDDAGKVARWFGTGTDIHEQKRAEESSRFLAEASAALAGVVDYESTLQKVANLAVPYFADWSAVDVANDDGTLRRLAVAHQDPAKIALVHELVREYPPEPHAPVGAFAVLRTGEPEIISDISDELLVQEAKDERHLRLIRSLGLKSYLCVPLVVSGQTLGVLTFATAESGRRYTEADLALAMDLAHRAAVAIENTRLYQALRDADRRKDEFLATLAHELRNPLAPIRNALQILKLPRVDVETAERSRSMMERQVHQLVRLVDDLLDVSRVMRGKIELRKEPVELATVVARAVETVQPLIDTQGHQLSVRISSESLLLDGDPVRLAQIIGNLLTNAAKYTEPNGRIWLTAEREDGMAVLRVRDNGIGIAPPMLARIFELFVQVDHTSTKAQGGLGIGLTLVKNLVEMHNGVVQARSEGLGRGSEFVVRLPISELAFDPDPGREAAASDLQPTTPSGYHLLVVDDNQDAADSLAMLLRLQGHEVHVAYSGVAALEMIKAYTPDVVFLDIGMPGMDGYEVARRLRQQPGLENVVLAALTGWGQKEDRRRTAEAGFNHHLVKPPEPKAVESVLAGLKSASEE
jgi:PAS domain S-box-containing protein